MIYFVLDVETIGLYGEAFAFGYVALDDEFKEFACSCFSCDPRRAYGTQTDHEWVRNNVPNIIGNCMNPKDVRDQFWHIWNYYQKQNALFFADCCYPVETNFIRQCVLDDPDNHIKHAPYPLHDVASIMFARGMDPLKNYDRLADELPKHHPLLDARQSARLLAKAMGQ